MNSYEFAVQADQNRTYSDGTMGGYEASDFLWGKVAAVEPTENVIRLPLAHRMACARVTPPVEGTGFADGEWARTDKQVLVTNTVQTASIDLATGTVSAGTEVGRNSIIPPSAATNACRVVVPQTVAGGTAMFSITIGGIPFKFSKSSEAFAYHRRQDEQLRHQGRQEGTHRRLYPHPHKREHHGMGKRPCEPRRHLEGICDSRRRRPAPSKRASPPPARTTPPCAI